MIGRLGQHFDRSELLYPSNWLSILRLILIPFAGLQLRRPGGRRRALWISALAVLTDFVDGPIARSRGEVSNLGKVLDPIADKLLINSLVAGLAARGEVPRWVLRLLLLRDAAIITGGIVLFRHRSYIAVSQLPGKFTTGFLSTALLLYLVNAPRWGRRLLQLSLVPLLLSLIQYSLNFCRIMSLRSVPHGDQSHEHKQNQRVE